MLSSERWSGPGNQGSLQGMLSRYKYTPCEKGVREAAGDFRKDSAWCFVVSFFCPDSTWDSAVSWQSSGLAKVRVYNSRREARPELGVAGSWNGSPSNGSHDAGIL